MKYESILIITYGRSGSTLLQGILNSIEGCLIRGENAMFCQGLFDAYRSILIAKEHVEPYAYIRKDQTNPWYGAQLLDEELFLSSMQKLIKKLLLADQYNSPEINCYGFKEIRYIQLNDSFSEYLDFMTKVFPNVAFIFNTRNLDDVIKSDFWKNHPRERSLEKLKNLELLFDQYHATHSNTFKITYEDVINKTPVLKDMFEFIGAKYSNKTIDAVLSTPHSAGPTQEHIKSLFVKKPNLLNRLSSFTKRKNTS